MASTSVSLASLPDHVLAIIFSHLPLSRRIVFEIVCKRWQQVLRVLDQRQRTFKVRNRNVPLPANAPPYPTPLRETDIVLAHDDEAVAEIAAKLQKRFANSYSHYETRVKPFSYDHLMEELNTNFE